jgi:PAS domain S-box-containing protein
MSDEQTRAADAAADSYAIDGPAPRPTWRRVLLGLAVGLVGVGLVTLLKLALDTSSGDDRLYVLYILPVAAAAFFGGWWAGLAIIAAAMGSQELLLWTDDASLADWRVALLPLVAFLGTAALVIWLVNGIAGERRAALIGATRNRSLLRSLVEQMGDGVIAADAGGSVMLMNKVARKRGMAEGPERSVLRRAMAGRESVVEEVPTQDAAGRDRLLDVHAQPLLNAAGDLLGGVATWRDVTKDRRESEAVRAQAVLLQTVLDTVTDAVVCADTTGRLTLFNLAARDMLSRGAEDVPPEEWAEHYATYRKDGVTLIEPDELPLVRALGGETVPPTPILLRPQGRADRHTVWNAVPLRDSTGTITGGIAIGRDITAQRLAEADRLRLWEASLDILAEADFDGRWLSLSPAWAQILGHPHVTTVGTGVFDLIHPDDLDQARAAFAQATAGQPLADLRLRFRRVDGTHRWLSWSVAPEPARRRLHGVARDVTAVMARQERERALIAELKRSNGELQDFASVASHDLQEPLRKIAAFGDRLNRKSEGLDEQGRDYLDRMLKAAARMQVLISDLLTFSRVVSRAKPPEQIDLTAATQAVLGDLEVAATEAGARIEVGRLPTIEADSTQIRQVLQNLIGNALKFRREDIEPVIHITGHLLKPGQGEELAREDLPEPLTAVDVPTAEIRIADNGIGFEPRLAHKVFQIFQRLHGRDAYAGTGIGLALCRKIAVRHGGTLAVQTTLGEGCTFILRLPVEAHTPPDHGEALTAA